MLVNCVAYQNGKKLADIPVEDISEYVSKPDCFVWVALFDPTQEEMDVMAAEFRLHPLAVEDGRKGHQRPKIDEYDESLLAVLQTVEAPPDPGQSGLLVGELDIFVGPNYILSVRHRTKQGFASVRARCEREPELLRFGRGSFSTR
jgi:magnesium transporter